MKAKYLFSLITLSLVFGVVGCGNTGGDTKDDTFVITSKTSSMEQGDTFEITTDSKKPLSYESTNTDVLTVSNVGVMTALSEGTSRVVVSNGKYSEKFDVTVNTDFEPVIIIDESESLSIYEQQKYDLEPKISYKGSVDSSFKNFSFESYDTNIVTVDEEGVISAVNIGETTIEVSATYRYYEISGTIDVEVCEAKYIYFDKQMVELSILGEGAYKNTEKLSALVVIEGEVVKDANVQYFVGDPNVVSFNNNIITALSTGSTTITASYQGLLTTCNVRVYKPNIDTGLLINYEMGKDIVIPEFEYKDLVASNIEAMYLDGVDVSLNHKQLNRDLVIGSPDVQKFVIETHKASYNVSMIVYNLIINTKNDLLNALPKISRYLADKSDVLKGYSFSGYIVLNDDIDFGGDSFRGLVNPNDCAHETQVGTFYPNSGLNAYFGIFEGNNHTISNIVFDQVYSSLMGAVAGEAIVRNVNLVNTRVCSSSSGSISSSTNNAVTFENIKIKGYLDVNNVKFENSYHASGLFFASMPSSSIKVKNCIVEMIGTFNENQRAGYFGYAYTTHEDATPFDKVIVIGISDQLYGYCPKSSSQFAEEFVHANEREGITHYSYRYEYDIYLDLQDGYTVDSARSVKPTCTKQGLTVLTKPGFVDKEYVINATGHEIVDGRCIHEGCNLVILDKVYKDGDIKQGFDFKTLSAATLLSVTKDGKPVELNNGVISFATADVSSTPVSYLAEFDNDTMVPVDITVYNLLIKNEQDLKNVNTYLTIGSDAPCTLGHIKLMNDITLTSNWDDTSSIGICSGYEDKTARKWYYTNKRGFNGTFDGNNYVISNFNVSQSDNNENCTGLFFAVGDDAVIKNFTMKGSTNIGQTNTRGGFLCGKAYGGNFENITLEVDIKNDGCDKSHAAGAMLGYLNDSAYSGTINVKNVTVINKNTAGTTYNYANPFAVESDDYYFQNPDTCPNAHIYLTDVTFVGYSIIYFEGKPVSGSARGYTDPATLPSYITCNNVRSISQAEYSSAN